MILSASPVELTRLLHQKAISSVRDAREHLANGRIRERSSCINKAYDILVELLTSLRPEEAPDLAARLSGLYCYMQTKLLEANFAQADAPLAEVVGLLTTLAEAWTPAPEVSAPPRHSPSQWEVGGGETPHFERVAVSA
jgi:flagellar protein FliS